MIKIKENAISEKMLFAIRKILLSLPSSVDRLKVVQQLNLAGIEIRKIASNLEEEYKNSIHMGNH